MEGTNTIKTYKLSHSATALLQDIKINQAVTETTEQESRKRNIFLLHKPMFTVSCALFNGMFPFYGTNLCLGPFAINQIKKKSEKKQPLPLKF